ncbi:MAG: 6-bladed beta-propeller [Deltaproteobacteria bacterium HGW-Deltaproteobacteria-4]|nr:MAG: 6-bladed beta-propeller [Deltaproteobacteria bacterium HGW-Deltaproteobacteria-4]
MLKITWPRLWRSRFTLLLVGAVCTVLAACAAPAGLRSSVDSPVLQWPAPPAPASIEWVQSVENYIDAGISKGFWGKLRDVLAGSADSSLGRPYGVHLDRQSRLLIVDSGSAVLHLMDMKRNEYTIIGRGPGRTFQQPIAVAEDAQGDLYITDSAAGLVYRYNAPEQGLVPFVRLQRPTGIAFNPLNQLLYVTDTLAHQIVAFDSNGNERIRLGGRGERAGDFNFPTDLFIDRHGKIYVTDPLNFRIQIFSPTGIFLTSLGGSDLFSKPKGVATDSEGNIYVCDAMLDLVRVFDAAGNPLFDFGGRGIHPGEFWMPSGIHINADDMILVTDTYNRRVQVFRHLRKDQSPPGK